MILLSNPSGSSCAISCECAEAIARGADQKADFLRQFKEFADQAAPERYPDLLKKTAAASKLSVSWQGVRDADISHEEEMIDEASQESFPASDPPSFSHAHA